MNHILDERPAKPARPQRSGIGRRSRRRQLVAAVASLAVAAAVVAGYAMSARDARPDDRRTTAGHTATLAVKVLRAAATHAAGETVTAEARPGQWIYTKVVDAGYNNSDPTADSNWVTFDGSQNAYYSQGRLVVHTSDPNPPGPGVPPWKAWNEAISGMTACNVLESLPPKPQQLLTVIDRHMGTIADTGGDDFVPFSPPPATQAQAEFAYLTHIMWNTFLGAGCPPAALTAAYRALATLPGISVQTGISDAVGAPAIGLSDDGGYSQLLLSPASYQVIGFRVISTGTNPVLLPLEKLSGARKAAALKRFRIRERRGRSGPWPPRGQVVASVALLRAAEVAAPGDV